MCPSSFWFHSQSLRNNAWKYSIMPTVLSASVCMLQYISKKGIIHCRPLVLCQSADAPRQSRDDRCVSVNNTFFRTNQTVLYLGYIVPHHGCGIECSRRIRSKQIELVSTDEWFTAFTPSVYINQSECMAWTGLCHGQSNHVIEGWKRGRAWDTGGHTRQDVFQWAARF